MKTRYVLSLCGGGTSGYMSSNFLSNIEENLNTPLGTKFDLVVGVSTGSILGSLICNDIKCSEISNIYKESHKNVFYKKHWFRAILKSLYKNEDLEKDIMSYFGNSTIDSLPTNFMTYALSLSNPKLKTVFFKSWKDKVKIKDVISASCSAPLAFEPTYIDGIYYVDGGLSLNDPSLCAYVEAKHLFPNDEIKILNMQTDCNKGYSNAKYIRGLLGVFSKMSQLSIDGGEDVIRHISESLMGDNFYNVNPNVYLSLDSDKWDYMDDVVDDMLKIHKDKIIDFLS